MRRFFLWFISLAFLGSLVAADVEPTPLPASSPSEKNARPAQMRAMVIPVRTQIDTPVLYILRRGLKTAIEEKYDVVVLDMDTPGGSLATTFEILEALEKFPGLTVTYINKDALSAGAFISAMTREIYFAPNGVIGAAAPVSGSGEDIDKTMKQKVVSYLKARVRALSEGKGVYRGEVISSMVDEDYELKIGERVIKKKGELLSLTAKEAAEEYGTPAQPLLATGIATSVDDLLATKYGENNYAVTRLEVTWSEELAVFLNSIKPILLGLGMLAIFIEMKTPGFGFFGITGAVLLGVVFLSSYAAGLSGHEPVLLFVIGGSLIALEVLLFPGVVILALTGLIMMLGALVWAMTDLWPNRPIVVQQEALLGPLLNLLGGLTLAGLLALVFARFIPKGWIFTRLALAEGPTAPAQFAGVSAGGAKRVLGLVGSLGTAATDLFPSGQIEIDGARYEARVSLGSIPAGTRVRVVRVTDFGLIVEEVA